MIAGSPEIDVVDRIWTTLAVGGGKIYWAGRDSDKIYRENLDGTGKEVLVSGLSRPMGIALDLVNNRCIYNTRTRIETRRPPSVWSVFADGERFFVAEKTGDVPDPADI